MLIVALISSIQYKWDTTYNQRQNMFSYILNNIRNNSVENVFNRFFVDVNAILLFFFMCPLSLRSKRCLGEEGDKVASSPLFSPFSPFPRPKYACYAR